MKFCTQCGNSLVPGDRFCQQCGFDTFSAQPPSLVETETNTPSQTITAGQPTDPVSQPIQNEPEKPMYNFLEPSKNSVSQSKSRKPMLLFLFALIGIGALGGGGWFVYKEFIEKPKEASLSLSNDSIADAQPQPTDLVDKALKEYSTKAKKPVPTSNPSGNDNMAVVLLEVGRYDEPDYKNPKTPTKLMLQKPTMIVSITTDHYNNGMGAPIAGNITIKDRDENVVGTFKAAAIKGKSGLKAGKWMAQIHTVLEPGTYFIWDSEFPTWTKNYVGNGFVVIEGYEVGN